MTGSASTRWTFCVRKNRLQRGCKISEYEVRGEGVGVGMTGSASAMDVVVRIKGKREEVWRRGGTLSTLAEGRRIFFNDGFCSWSQLILNITIFADLKNR